MTVGHLQAPNPYSGREENVEMSEVKTRERIWRMVIGDESGRCRSPPAELKMKVLSELKSRCGSCVGQGQTGQTVGVDWET